jgi:thiamine pyrophosphate-dependent acetolactate synthase large subunit-like protein
MYSVQSFWTAAHHNIPVVYIILSNRTYRILKLNMNRYRRTLDIPAGRPYSHLDLTNPTLDFVEIAHGMGVPGKRITHPEEIQPAVTAALTLGTPYVLEVVTEGGVPAQ